MHRVQNVTFVLSLPESGPCNITSFRSADAARTYRQESDVELPPFRRQWGRSNQIRVYKYSGRSRPVSHTQAAANAVRVSSIHPIAFISSNSARARSSS